MASSKRADKTSQVREVLKGVGTDGVGVKFHIFPVNCSYLPLVLGKRAKKRRKTQKKGRSPPKSEEKRKKAQKKGRFPPAPPSTPTPLRTSQQVHVNLEADSSTPPVLGGAPIFDSSAPALYKLSLP